MTGPVCRTDELTVHNIDLKSQGMLQNHMSERANNAETVS